MCSKAVKIHATLEKMIKCMPECNEKQIMKKISNGVIYKSPEVCDNYWNDVYLYVSSTFTDYKSSWQRKMRHEYHEGITKYADEFWV